MEGPVKITIIQKGASSRATVGTATPIVSGFEFEVQLEFGRARAGKRIFEAWRQQDQSLGVWAAFWERRPLWREYRGLECDEGRLMSCWCSRSTREYSMRLLRGESAIEGKGSSEKSGILENEPGCQQTHYERES